MQPSVYERLNALEKIGIKLGLNNIQTLLASLDNPQNSFASLLIAGTNGKGSVGAMLHQILIQHSFVAGHYTSPHLVDVRERIKIGSEIISAEQFEAQLTRLFEQIDALLANGELQNAPTYFEVLTALAFVEFARSKVDFAVVEVGMGGRFDATNVLLPRICIITTIGLDHEEYLGSTLAEIASEKAGIIKPGVPVVTGELPAEATAVIRKKANEAGAPLATTFSEDVAGLHLEDGYPVFLYRPFQKEVRVNLAGSYQAENASVALLASSVLKQDGVSIETEKIIKALNEVRWPGRLERIDEDGLRILIDCAHNPMGAATLSDHLRQTGWDKCVVLFAAMRDKNFAAMLSAVAPRTAKMILTSIPPFERCAAALTLQETARNLGIDADVQEPASSAFARARACAAKHHLPLVIFGSIYLIGEILRESSPRR